MRLIKRIIVGVGIALIVSFLKSNGVFAWSWADYNDLTSTSTEVYSIGPNNYKQTWVTKSCSNSNQNWCAFSFDNISVAYNWLNTFRFANHSLTTGVLNEFRFVYVGGPTTNVGVSSLTVYNGSSWVNQDIKSVTTSLDTGSNFNVVSVQFISSVDNALGVGIYLTGNFYAGSYSISPFYYLVSNVDNSAAIYDNTNTIIQKQNETNQQLDEVNDNLSGVNENLDDINDTMNNDNIDSNNTTDTITNLSSQIASNNVISDLLLLPVTLFQNILNSINGSCSTFSLGSLYNTNLTLPCIDLQSILGSTLYTSIDILISGIFILSIRKKFVNIFENLSSLKNGGNELE